MRSVNKISKMMLTKIIDFVNINLCKLNLFESNLASFEMS